MLVFWKARLVFLAVPKTGSSAYHAALAPMASVVVSDPPELKHAPIYRYNRFFRPMFERVGGESLEIMAVVREPVSWLGSWFRYRQRAFLDGKPTSTKGIGFNDFVEAYCAGQRPPYAEVGSQAKFLEPRPNGVSATHVFQYESPDAIDGFLRTRLDTGFEVPRTNVSPPSKIDLSATTRAKLERKFSADFELWENARRA